MAQEHGLGGAQKKLISAAKWWAEGCPGIDIDESHYQTLRDQGWSEDALATERAEVELLREPRLVWPSNWAAAVVFLRCSWERQVLSGMTKVALVYQGITTQEVFYACRMRRVPSKDWDEVLCGVRVMVDTALPLLNARATESG